MQPTLRFALFFAALGVIAACGTQPVAHWRPQWFKNGSRQPASALPAGYQVKNQDHWLLGVWEKDENSPLLAVCNIRRTPVGFEAGSSKDSSGAAIMMMVQDQRDQKFLDKLTSSTSQGFEDGYAPYWSDCRTEKSDKCAGRLSLLTFLSFQGVGEMNGSSTDLYDERNVAVGRGEKTWRSSAVSSEILAAAKCLCAKYARPEEKEYFPNKGCDELGAVAAADGVR